MSDRITMNVELRRCPVGTILEIEPYSYDIAGVSCSSITVGLDAQVVQLVERDLMEGDFWYFIGSEIPYKPENLHMPAKVIRWGTG